MLKRCGFPRRFFMIQIKLYLNKDKTHTNKILNALKVTNGYCPCQIAKNDESLCKFSEEYLPDTIDVSELCKNGIKEGICHCGLYLLSNTSKESRF